MFRSLRDAALAAVLALSTLGTFGEGTALGAYVSACGATDNQHAYVDYVTTNHIRYFQAKITSLLNTATCTGSNIGSSWVVPVNLQGGRVAAAVQLGYGHTGTGPLRFLYTPVDYDMHLVAPSQTAPITGHSYTFSIQFVSSIHQWQYVVTDNTAQTTQIWYGDTSSAYDDVYATEAWSGFEVWNANDQLGGAGTKIYIQDMYMSFTSGGSAYITSTTVHKGCCSPYSWKSYWSSAADTYNGHARINAYTSSH